MNQHYNNTCIYSYKQKAVAGALAAVTALVMLFSFLYIVAEASHDCDGNDCPICACISQCANTLRHTGGNIKTIIFISLLTILFMNDVLLKPFCDMPSTLVAQKIRMDD